MEVKPVIAEQRRQAILRLIEEHGFIRISNLGERFNVTDMTIRRDIDYLSNLGLVKRVHGGAVSENDQGMSLATTFLKRNAEYKSEKERIGIRAQDYVHEGTTLFIDGGSTNELFARHLDPRSGLKIVTHALNVAWILSQNESHELFVPGGVLNRLTMTFNGPEVEKMYEEMNGDVLFISATGISLENGLTDPTWLDSSIKRAMIRSCRMVILLIDSHKFDLVSSRTYASLDQVDLIITDTEIDDETRERYCGAGVDIVLT
jgi:DeoR/GlpR family transcriptional regulator of sugar metabolism